MSSTLHLHSLSTHIPSPPSHPLHPHTLSTHTPSPPSYPLSTHTRAGGYVVLESCFLGSDESYTDDDDDRDGAPGDPGIDLSKLLSSFSQTGEADRDGGVPGPNLSRRLMTHLRLLQASLQHLKVTLILRWSLGTL